LPQVPAFSPTVEGTLPGALSFSFCAICTTTQRVCPCQSAAAVPLLLLMCPPHGKPFRRTGLAMPFARKNKHRSLKPSLLIRLSESDPQMNLPREGSTITGRPDFYLFRFPPTRPTVCLGRRIATMAPFCQFIFERLLPVRRIGFRDRVLRPKVVECPRAINILRFLPV